MRAAANRAIQRGTVGAWKAFTTSRGIGIIDPNEWAVAEFGTYTQSHYVEIVSVHETKKAAQEFRRHLLTGKPRHSWERFVLLKKQDDGTWARA